MVSPCRNETLLTSVPGGVLHDPQRLMGKNVNVPHFNRDTVEYASRAGPSSLNVTLLFGDIWTQPDSVDWFGSSLITLLQFSTSLLLFVGAS